MSLSLLQKQRARRVAGVVSEVLAPIVLVVADAFAVAIHAEGMPKGALLGLVAAFFAGGLPYAFVRVRVRSGQLVDRDVSRREQRPLVMILVLASVGSGLLVLRLLDAPRQLFALLAAMAAGMAVSLAISLFWKVSLHSAVAGGSVTALAALIDIRLLALSPLVGLVGWARVEVQAHTAAQVAVGALVGAIVGGGVAALIG